MFQGFTTSISQSLSSAAYALQNITIREVVDIAVVSIALYLVILFIKQTKSYFLIGVVLIVTLVSILSQNLELSLTRTI